MFNLEHYVYQSLLCNDVNYSVITLWPNMNYFQIQGLKSNIETVEAANKFSPEKV